MFDLLHSRFFQLFQLCQMQELETVALCLRVLQTSAAELCLVQQTGKPESRLCSQTHSGFRLAVPDIASHVAA